jgi:hypothetical protein
VYPGIDVVYSLNQRQLEFDFVITPGADPGRIDLSFPATGEVQLLSNGDLSIQAATAAIVLGRPYIYQAGAAGRLPIEGGYRLTAPGRVGFWLGPYDHDAALVIDPVVSRSTYLGGSSNDEAFGIATDAAGSVYVTGVTESANLPVTTGAVMRTKSNRGDAFVAKYDSQGTLVYLTYLGGNDSDRARRIAVDSSGSAYVLGETLSTNFPTTSGAIQRFRGGSQDMFASKLSPDGSSLLYSTYVGGSAIEFAGDIAVDAAGAAYLTGSSASDDYPTRNAFRSRRRPGQCGLPPILVTQCSDAVVTKLNPSGSAIEYSTYLIGAEAGDNSGVIGYGGEAIAVDAGGRVIVAGDDGLSRADIPTTPGALRIGSGDSGTFIFKLAPDGSREFSALLTANNTTGPRSLALDAIGNIYLYGVTFATNFPTTAGAFQTSLRGDRGDGFVTKIDPSGSRLLYSTYVGGSDNEDQLGGGILVDPDGAVYVAGATRSANFPVTPDATQSRLAGAQDAFLAKLDPTGSRLVFATFLGGTSNEEGRGLARGAGGSIWIAGMTSSTNLPVTPGAPQANTGGGSDAFLTQFSGPFEGIPAPTIRSLDPSGGTAGQTIANFVINGQDLGGVTAVEFAPAAGITVSNLRTTASSVTAQLVIAANATVGTRAVTVMSPGGRSNSLNFTIRAAPSPLSLFSAASGSVAVLAPDSIASAYGQGLADSVVVAPAGSFPQVLGGVSVTVTDSANVERPTQL